MIYLLQDFTPQNFSLALDLIFKPRVQGFCRFFALLKGFSVLICTDTPVTFIHNYIESANYFNLIQSASNKYKKEDQLVMGISSASEYVDFFINLDMGENVSLISFVNNEKLVLKQKLEYKNLPKEPIKKGIEILEQLAKEISEMGQKRVIEKYQKQGR